MLQEEEEERLLQEEEEEEVVLWLPPSLTAFCMSICTFVLRKQVFYVCTREASN